MPGFTPELAIPYMLAGETNYEDAFAALAQRIDTLINEDELAVADLLDPPFVRLSGSSDTSAAQNVETSVVFTALSVVIDNDGMFSLGAPDRITINTPGIYLFFAQSSVTGFATITSWRVSVFQNGVRRASERKVDPVAGPSNVNPMLACNAGDFVQVRGIWTGTGGPGTIEGTDFWATRLRPL